MTQATTTAPLAPMAEVNKMFRRTGQTLAAFVAEWKALSDQDKTEIRQGIGNGTMTY
jgi:hypothetical protein